MERRRSPPVNQLGEEKKKTEQKENRLCFHCSKSNLSK